MVGIAAVRTFGVAGGSGIDGREERECQEEEKQGSHSAGILLQSDPNGQSDH